MQPAGCSGMFGQGSGTYAMGSSDAVWLMEMQLPWVAGCTNSDLLAVGLSRIARGEVVSFCVPAVF